jgi:hypothetical protein
VPPYFWATSIRFQVGVSGGTILATSGQKLGRITLALVATAGVDGH